MGAQQVEFLISGVVDSSGDPLASGKVYFYEAGTTTNKTIWTDQAKTTPASNPVVLDSRGSAEIFAEGLYDIKIDDSSDSNISTWDDQYFSDDRFVVDTSTTSLNNSAAETTMFSKTFDGTKLSTDSVIEIFWAFDYIDTGVAGTADVTVRISISGDTTEDIAEFGIENLTGHATGKGAGFVRGVIYGDGTTNRTHFELIATDCVAADATDGTGLGVSHHEVCSDTFSQTFDGTDTITATAQWDAASANYTFRTRYAHLNFKA